MSFAAPMAHFYDVLNDGADYSSERDRIVSFLPEGARRGVDLGCGTGSLCLLLAQSFEMTGVDLSEEMLACADEKAFSAGKKVRFVCQDITRLALGETFDFCLCLHDTLNYLSSREELGRLFSRVEKHLSEKGVFVFDINRKQRFEEVYCNSCEILERNGLFCVWERAWHPSASRCDFAFHFFEKQKNGLYEKSEEYESQRYFPPSTVEKLCREAGLSAKAVFENDTHHLYVATHMRG